MHYVSQEVGEKWTKIRNAAVKEIEINGGNIKNTVQVGDMAKENVKTGQK